MNKRILKEMQEKDIDSYLFNKYYRDACVYAHNRTNADFKNRFDIIINFLFTGKWNEKYKNYKLFYLKKKIKEEKTKC